MKSLLTKKNVIVVILMAVISTTGGSIYFNNKKLKSNFITERLKSENLLLQKLQLEKSLELLKINKADLQINNSELQTKVAEIDKQIHQKNTEINKLKIQNASIADLKRKIGELESLKKQYDEEMSKLSKSLALIQSENSMLNEKIKSAENINSLLSDDNNLLKLLLSDNYRIEALRGKNEKLTVNARKTKKLTVSFDVPTHVAVKDIFFKVFTPEGFEYSSDKDLAATIHVTDIMEQLIASTEHPATLPEGKQRIEMNFKPINKLTEGIYRFNVYNGERFIGSTQLKLK